MICTHCHRTGACAVGGCCVFPDCFIEFDIGTTLCQNCLDELVEDTKRRIEEHRQNAKQNTDGNQQ